MAALEYSRVERLLLVSVQSSPGAFEREEGAGQGPSFGWEISSLADSGNSYLSSVVVSCAAQIYVPRRPKIRTLSIIHPRVGAEYLECLMETSTWQIGGVWALDTQPNDLIQEKYLNCTEF